MLDTTITKWTSKEQKQKVIQQILNTNKPIKYTYLAGFDRNGMWIYETEVITANKVQELFSYFESYFIIETKQEIKIKRVN